MDSNFDDEKLLDETPAYEGRPTWNPTEPGEKLIGILLNREKRKSRDSEDVWTVLTIRSSKDGKTYDRWANPSLEPQIEIEDPKIGDLIGIRYDGIKKTLRGRGLKRYTLKVLRRAKEQGNAEVEAEGTDGAEVAEDEGYPTVAERRDDI